MLEEAIKLIKHLYTSIDKLVFAMAFMAGLNVLAQHGGLLSIMILMIILWLLQQTDLDEVKKLLMERRECRDD